MSPPSSPLRALGAYRKMLRPRLTVAVVTDGYHVQQEALRALCALGHKTVLFDTQVAGPNEPPNARIARLVRLVAEHRPDMLLSVNYVGFDRAGWMGEVVETLRLPLALWFVDSPLFFAMGYLPPTKTMTSSFVWDKTHAQALRSWGAERVYPLPLGCELATFAEPAPPPPSGLAAPMPLLFVGSSLVPLGATWHGRLQQEEHEAAAQMARTLGQDRQALHALVPSPAPPIDRRAVMAAWANCAASRPYRRQLLKALPQQHLHVVGDGAWRQELPAATVHPQVGYGAALAALYRHATINVNATILQMPTAVNQRVFDVPAAGGFLLTDDQAEVHDLFDVDRGEAVTFRNADELGELALRYGQDAPARAAVVARARARVVAEHSYTHRLGALVAQMRRDHGPRQLAR